jgi:hypothetical protein
LAPIAQPGGTVTYTWYSGASDAHVDEVIQTGTSASLPVPTNIPGVRHYRYVATHENDGAAVTGNRRAEASSAIVRVELRYAELTMVNGRATLGASGEEGKYAAGERVDVEADDPPAGSVFRGWTQDAGGAAGHPISDLPSGPSGGFTMPASDVTLTAAYATSTPSSQTSPGSGPSAATSTPASPSAAADGTDRADEPEDTWPFIDVTVNRDWFYSDVEYVFRRGLMIGVSEELFEPVSTVTRAMLVTILYRVAQPEDADYAPEAFTDVPNGLWYSDAVAWGAANGIVLGYGDGRFGPDDDITREQLTALLYRYNEWAFAAASDGAGMPGFTDADKIADWAYGAVAWAARRGVVKGRPGGVFDPQDTATRAEAAAMLRRYMENAG